MPPRRNPVAIPEPIPAVPERRYQSHRVETFQKLEGIHDYALWQHKAKAALIQTNCWSAIEPDADEVVDRYTERHAHSHLILWLSDGVLTQVKNIDAAKPLWDKLKALYEPAGFSTDFLYMKEFFATELAMFDSVEEYVAKLKTLADDLRKHELVIPDKMVMAWTLFHLNESYKNFVANVIQSLRQNPNAYTFDLLVVSLLDEARLHEAQDTTYVAVARRGHKNATTRSKSGSGAQSRMYTESRSSKNKPSNDGWTTVTRKNKVAKRVHCTNCKKNGHVRSDCYFLHPDKAPKGWTDHTRGQESQTTGKSHKKPIQNHRENRDKALVTAAATRANRSRSSSEDSDESEHYTHMVESMDTSQCEISDQGSNHGSDHGSNHEYSEPDHDILMANILTEPKRVVGAHANAPNDAMAQYITWGIQNNASETQSEPTNAYKKKAKNHSLQTPIRRSKRVAQRPRNEAIPQLTETPTEPQWANATLAAMREGTEPITII
jgi:hypothetical protein